MKKPPIVTKLDVTEFSYELQDIRPHEKTRIGIYTPGSKHTMTARVVRVFTDQGITGEYVGGGASEHAAIPQFA